MFIYECRNDALPAKCWYIIVNIYLCTLLVQSLITYN